MQCASSPKADRLEQKEVFFRHKNYQREIYNMTSIFYSKVHSVETGTIQKLVLSWFQAWPKGNIVGAQWVSSQSTFRNTSRYRATSPRFDRYPGNSGPDMKQFATIALSGQTRLYGIAGLERLH